VSRVILFPAAIGRRPDPVPTVTVRPRPLHDAVAEARRRHRQLVTTAGQWAMARGLSLPADHVAVWAAAAACGGSPGDVDGVTGPWLATELQEFVESTVGAWCALAGCQLPAGLPDSLHHLYAFLADSGRLHRASDPLPELHAALAPSGGPDVNGRLELTTFPGPSAA
jgi:hypothetical protein